MGGGREEGDLFDGVVAAVRLPGGEVAVADGRSSLVRIFDREGHAVRTVGREGAGPGEFEHIAGMVVGPGDSLAVWDARHARLTLLPPDGGQGRSVRAFPPPGGLFVPLVGVFPDASFVVASAVSVGNVFESGTGLRRDSLVVVRYGADGGLRGTVATVPGDERFAWVGPTGFSLVRLPFGRRTTVARRGDRVIVATGDGQEVMSYLLEGGGARPVARHPEGPREVTPEDVQAFKAAALAAITDPTRRAAEETRLAALPFPHRWPPYLAALVDAVGNVWTGGLTAVDDPSAVEWSVFREDGSLLGSVRTPVGLEVLEVGDGWVLGVSTDSLGVQSVRLHELRKPQSPSTGMR